MHLYVPSLLKGCNSRAVVWGGENVRHFVNHVIIMHNCREDERGVTELCSRDKPRAEGGPRHATAPCPCRDAAAAVEREHTKHIAVAHSVIHAAKVDARASPVATCCAFPGPEVENATKRIHWKRWFPPARVGARGTMLCKQGVRQEIV